MPADNAIYQGHMHQLYSNHHGWLYGLLRRRLGNAFDAADLAQDTFLRLLLKPLNSDRFGGTRAYLSTIAQGLCIDLWRHREIERAWLDVLATQPEALEPSAEHRAVILETLQDAARPFVVDTSQGRLRVKGAGPLNGPDRVLAMLESALPVQVRRTLPWWVTVAAGPTGDD